MDTRMTSWLSWPSLVRTVVSHIRLSLRLLREPTVPILAKALPVVALLYVISPLDFVPDFMPILGQLDDLGVFLLGLETFLKLCPTPALDFHRTALAQGEPFHPMPAAGEVIDAEFRHEDGGQR
jgi:uncharacterized membrane protein YkvA (DUF1232 family)